MVKKSSNSNSYRLMNQALIMGKINRKPFLLPPEFGSFYSLKIPTNYKLWSKGNK